MVRATHMLDEVTSEWRLTMSIPKTNLLVVGIPCDEQDWQPIDIRGDHRNQCPMRMGHHKNQHPMRMVLKKAFL